MKLPRPRNASSKFEENFDTFFAFHLSPFVADETSVASASLLPESYRRSKKRTLTRPAASAAIHGNHWSWSAFDALLGRVR